MPATPDEMRLIKEQFADLFISYQRGEIDLPDALTAVRDFEIPVEIPAPEGAPTPPEGSDDGSGADGGDAGAGGTGEAQPPVVSASSEDGTSAESDAAALAEAQAELDEALATAFSRSNQ